MSTSTCSTFLSRKCLTPYLEEKYLLAANGPYLELFDLNKLREKEDNVEYVPMKTRVTPNSTIYHLLPLEESGHVIVISSETRRKCRTLFLHIVHSEIIQRGGYVPIDASASFILSREENFKGNCPCDTRAELMKGSNEFVLATSTFIARFGYSLSSSEGIHDAEICEIEKFDLRSILPQHLSSECLISPCCISPSLPLKFMLHTSILNKSDAPLSSLFLIHIIDSSPIYHQILDDESKVQILLPGLNFGILCGDEFVSLVSTSIAPHDEEDLEELVRAVNPFSSPVKIVARENESTTKATIVIFCIMGISVWTVRGKLLSLQYFIDHSLLNNRTEILQKAERRNVLPLVVQNIPHFDHVDGLVDGVFVKCSNNKTNSGKWDLLISRRAGCLDMITDDNFKSQKILLSRSTLYSCPKTPMNNFNDIFVFNHKSYMEFSATIISIDFLAAECFKMNNKGHLNLIYRRPLSDCEIPLLKATCCDVKYDPVKNETYILVGTETGQVYLREIDNISDQSETPKESYILYSEKTQILSIRFFEQQYSENSSNYHAVLTSTTLKFMCMNPNEDTFNATHLHSIKTGRSIDLSKIKNMLTLGDGEIVHDIWLISDTSAYLLIGRNQEYYPRKHVELQFSDWKGSITASCSLSTKKSVHEDYLDVIFVAKGPKIGILVVLHMEDDPANVIQFTDWKMPKGSDAIAIHTELLKYEVTNDVHILDIRLYAMKRKSGTLHISVCRLVVDGSGVSVSKQSRPSKFTIPTSIRNPHHIVVTNISRIDTKPDTEPPKFVIVSGSNGSQVVRICPNKQLYSKDLDKIVSSSSVDQEHLSDGE